MYLSSGLEETYGLAFARRRPRLMTNFTGSLSARLVLITPSKPELQKPLLLQCNRLSFVVNNTVVQT